MNGTVGDRRVNNSSIRFLSAVTGCLIVVLMAPRPAHGQTAAAQGRATQPPATARSTAPFDLTGYWVSIVTQNWRLRMVPPAKGDYIGIPISAAAKKVADVWDLARDEAAGDQCKPYGAAAIMNLPTRLHITWQDDNTLRMDIDNGTQTRVFRFGHQIAGTRRTLQGDSVAIWEGRRGSRPTAPTAKYLKVDTKNMLAGYLRKNGIPYGESAALREYFDVFQAPDGASIMIVTAVVEDPVYLETRYILSSQFRKENDGSRWDPTPCSLRW